MKDDKTDAGYYLHITFLFIQNENLDIFLFYF